MEDLKALASLLRDWNAIGSRISAIVQRPATIGHVGEYIASRIFDLELEASATARGWDGRFRSGPLAGRTANVKWYPKLEGLLDIRPEYRPDYYLVLTGPRSPAISSRGTERPWLIQHVFLFEAESLIRILRERKIWIGIATSVRKELWTAAELYPEARCGLYPISSQQRLLLNLFSGRADELH